MAHFTKVRNKIVEILQKLCNNNGNCECGKCVCLEGYTGPTCGIIKPDKVQGPPNLEPYGNQKISSGETDEKEDANLYEGSYLTNKTFLFFLLFL